MTQWERLLELGASSANGHYYFSHEKVGEWRDGEFFIAEAGKTLIDAANLAEFGPDGDPAEAVAPATPEAPTPKPRIRKKLDESQNQELSDILAALDKAADASA